MKKILLGSLVVAFALTLSACGSKTQEQNQAGEMEKQIGKEGMKMTASIGEAMKSGKKMKCTFKIKAGNDEMESVSYFDGEKYRSESKVMNMNQIAVFDGENMYSWSEGQKSGMKFSKECADEMEEMNTEESQPQEEVKIGAEAFDGAMDVKCEEVSSIDFSIPTGVEFTDQCEMMKQMQNQAGDMQKQAEEMMKNMPNMPELQ